MFFGQETNDWEGDVKVKNTLEPILRTYDLFYNSDACYSYGGQFWNGIKRYKNLMQNKFPDKKIAFIWNNIVKIGKSNSKGYPGNDIHDVEKQHFNVIKEEIKIIKPNVLLFLTGPNYDNIIRDKFGKVEYNPVGNFTTRQLSKLSIDEIDFAFRTYHPNYLWRNGIDSYFNSLIGEMNFS